MVKGTLAFLVTLVGGLLARPFWLRNLNAVVGILTLDEIPEGSWGFKRGIGL